MKNSSILPSEKAQMNLSVDALNPTTEPQRHLYDHLEHLSPERVKKTLKQVRAKKASAPALENLDLFGGVPSAPASHPKP